MYHPAGQTLNSLHEWRFDLRLYWPASQAAHTRSFDTVNWQTHLSCEHTATLLHQIISNVCKMSIITIITDLSVVFVPLTEIYLPWQVANSVQPANSSCSNKIHSNKNCKYDPLYCLHLFLRTRQRHNYSKCYNSENFQQLWTFPIDSFAQPISGRIPISAPSSSTAWSKPNALGRFLSRIFPSTHRLQLRLIIDVALMVMYDLDHLIADSLKLVMWYCKCFVWAAVHSISFVDVALIDM